MRIDKNYLLPLQEEAPPGKNAENFIKANKGDFKKRYGSRWEEVLYAAAWNKYGTTKKEFVTPDPDAEMIEIRDAVIKEATKINKQDVPVYSPIKGKKGHHKVVGHVRRSATSTGAAKVGKSRTAEKIMKLKSPEYPEGPGWVIKESKDQKDWEALSKKYKGVPSTGIPYKDFSRMEKLKKKLGSKAKGFPKTTATGKKRFEETEIDETESLRKKITGTGAAPKTYPPAATKTKGRKNTRKKIPGKKKKNEETEIIDEAPLNLGKIEFPSSRDTIAIQRKLKAEAPEILKQYRKLVKKLEASTATIISPKEIVYIRTQPNEEYRKRTGLGDEHQIHMRPIRGDKNSLISSLGKEVVYHKGNNETVYNTVLAIKEDYISEAAKAKEIKAILKKFPSEAKRVKGGDSLSDKKNARLYSALDDYFHKKEPRGLRAAGDVYAYIEDAIDDVYAGDFKSFESFINEAIMVNFNTGVHSAQERWGRVHLRDLVVKFKKAKVKHETDNAYYVAFDVKSYNDSALAKKMSIGEIIADIQKNNGEIDFSERDSMGRIKKMESVEESGMYVKGKGLIDPKGKYAKKAPTQIERERKLPKGPAGSRSPVFKKAVKTYGKGDRDVKALEVLYKKRDALLKKKGDTDRIDKHIGSVEVHFTNSMNESTKDRSWKSYLSSTTNNNTINEVYMVNTQKQKDGSFKWILQSVEHKKTTVLDTGTESSRAKADRAGKNAKKKLKETSTDEENHLTKKFSHWNLPINNKDEETETKEPTYKTKYINGRKSIVKEEEMIREYTTILKEAVDKDTVRELVLYITNDAQLYRQRAQPIIKNLSKKVGNATYDGLKAIKAFMYLVKDGIKKYEKENATPGWAKAINKETKQKIATELLDNYTEEIGESYEKV